MPSIHQIVVVRHCFSLVCRVWTVSQLVDNHGIVVEYDLREGSNADEEKDEA